MSIGITVPTKAVYRLETLKAVDEGDGPGEAAPYLWVVYFKLDGDTMNWRVSRDGSEFGLTLEGTPVVSVPAGGHGNLGVSEAGKTVDAGETLPIPGSVGEWRSVLRPLPIRSDRDLSLVLPDGTPIETSSAFAGFVALFLEEDAVSNDTILEAHAVFEKESRTALSDLTSGLSIDLTPFITQGQVPTPEQALALVVQQVDLGAVAQQILESVDETVRDVVMAQVLVPIAAAFLAGNPSLFGVSLVNADVDDLIGGAVIVLSQDQLAQGRTFWGWKSPLPVPVEHPADVVFEGGGEDGSWEFAGRAFSIDVTSLAANLELAGFDPANGVRQAVGTGSVQEWIEES